jgi:CRP/FNR family cyclic AMP-dependent transcriptional regulator
VAEPRQSASTTTERFPAGATIFSAGERADCMYIVQDGVVDCLVGERVINTVGPGGILGEMALINHQPRSATARAKYDCELKRMDEATFMAAVRSNPAFALEVMRTLADRLRRQTAT